MKHYEEKTVTRVEKRVTHKTCDMCGHKSTNYGFSDSWDGDGGYYDIDIVEISVVVKHRTGSEYPEGGFGDEFKPDICPACFKDKILPALRALGLETSYEPWDC